jgi:hypothetical protein
MDQETREKIEKSHGLDFCCPGKQRMFCPKHCWDVPAIWRKRQEKFLKEEAKKEKPLTRPLANGLI